jgi:peptidoglycan hydrolase CwlO-like protein
MLKTLFILVLIFSIISIAGLAVTNKITADDNSGLGSVEAKLDKILQGQDRIMQQLDDMASQLQVIKIRATR